VIEGEPAELYCPNLHVISAPPILRLSLRAVISLIFVTSGLYDQCRERFPAKKKIPPFSLVGIGRRICRGQIIGLRIIKYRLSPSGFQK